MDWKVYNQQGEVVNTVELDKKIFQGEINQPILREAVLAHQANCRQGQLLPKIGPPLEAGAENPGFKKGLVEHVLEVPDLLFGLVVESLLGLTPGIFTID